MEHVYMPRGLPEALQPMVELALDLRWACSRAADRFWRLVDPDCWELTANPWLLLQNATEDRLEQLAADSGFLEALRRTLAERRETLSQANWFHQNGGGSIRGIAYFSMEFGLSEALPIYSGGLGLLAGDYLKSASDLGLPVTGVGLLYQEGYFRQMLTPDGWQLEVYPYNNPTGLPVQPVITHKGWLTVSVELPGRWLRLRVWRAMVGNVTLLLLDSNDPLNSPVDRGITGKLYGGNQEMRIQQELALGVGGWRALEALDIAVDVCHLNEGHAAFAMLERARSFMRNNQTSFWEALWATRPGNVFTTHTAVEAGFDKFEPNLARRYLTPFLASMKDGAPSLEDVLALGRQTGWNAAEPLNMAYLSMRGCGYANGVSKLHALVSRALFQPLYPRWPQAAVPVGSVTNGVHIPTWISEAAEPVWYDQGVDHGVERTADEEIWKIRNAERERLVKYARARLALQLGQRGADAGTVEQARYILDPGILTLGFARRFAEYKRPNLLLRDADRFRRLLTSQDRPVQIVIAGKAHPADQGGKSLIQNWLRWIEHAGVRHRAIFLEDYDIELTQNLVAGVDVWINTPRRPWEASGTSGMKVLANGGLNLSELDGWWSEAYSPEVGWAIGDRQVHEGGEDGAEAEQLYRLLEQEVVPAFYNRDERGVPRRWLALIRGSMARLARQFSSERMCREYVETLYMPAASLFARRSAEKGRIARELLQWHSSVSSRWREVHFGAFESHQDGIRTLFRVQVYLGSFAPDDMLVELYADSQGSNEPFRERMTPAERIPGSGDGYWYVAAAPASRLASDFTPRAIPFHADALIPAEQTSIVWRA